MTLPSNPGATAIHLKGIRKAYGDTLVIPRLDAKLSAGEFTVILGPSGCGKSTLLNMLAGLERVTEGQIVMGDRPVQDLAPKDRGVAMVFQNYALYPHMTVADNIGYALKLARVPKAERQARVAEAAHIVALDHLLERRPGEMSGGQRQRVAIARAIVREPQVMLFDEPLSNLDAKLRHEMRMELGELHRRIDATSIFVTHDQVEAMTLADRIMILNKGEIEQFDTPANIYHRPASTFVAGFIGSPPMNLLSATGADGVLWLDDRTELARHPARGSFTVGLRPENLRISDQGVPATVLYREDLGAHAVLLLRLQGGEQLRITTDLGSRMPDSSELRLQIDPADIHLFHAETGKALESNSSWPQPAPIPLTT